MSGTCDHLVEEESRRRGEHESTVRGRSNQQGGRGCNVKKKERGPPKKTQRPEPVLRGTDSEVESDTGSVEPEGASTPWISDSKFNPEKVREAQGRILSLATS